MTDQEKKTTPEEHVVQCAKVWRGRDRAANAKPSNVTNRAEYFARRKLRAAVDLLERKGAAK